MAVTLTTIQVDKIEPHIGGHVVRAWAWGQWIVVKASAVYVIPEAEAERWRWKP